MNVLKVKNKGFETFISILLENVKKKQKVSDFVRGYRLDV